jgi:sulfur carrier protein
VVGFPRKTQPETFTIIPLMGEDIRAFPRTAAQSIEIVVNGEQTQVLPELNLHELLGVLGIEGDRVAIELNRQIVSRRDWIATRIAPGAQVEIVQFVGGG